MKDATRISYGADVNQFADLRLPEGRGPFPVVAIDHGGCWAAFADVAYTAPLADALTREGWATWNIEYRRAHQPGGGWPGTFVDAAHGLDTLRAAAKLHPLDPARVVAIGHSAGGQLALWNAARPHARSGSAVFVDRPLPLRGAIAIGGLVDLRAFAAYAADPCEGWHIRVIGGTPAELPDRYALVSPAELLPLRVPHALVWGEKDNIAPQSLFAGYEAKARAAGDSVKSVIVAGAGHHDLMKPDRPAYGVLVELIRGLLGT